MEFKKQFKEAHPETIGEIDSHFDKSNYIDWIDKEYAKLKSDKAELLEALEEMYSKYEKDGHLLNASPSKIKSLIQKNKQ